MSSSLRDSYLRMTSPSGEELTSLGVLGEMLAAGRAFTANTSDGSLAASGTFGFAVYSAMNDLALDISKVYHVGGLFVVRLYLRDTYTPGVSALPIIPLNPSVTPGNSPSFFFDANVTPGVPHEVEWYYTTQSTRPVFGTGSGVFLVVPMGKQMVVELTDLSGVAGIGGFNVTVADLVTAAPIGE